MQATKKLPPEYQKLGSIDLKEDRRMLILMNVLALVGVIAFGWLFFWLIDRMRPGELLPQILALGGKSLVNWAGTAVAILLLTVLYIIVHEALHGLFFWIFTRSRPLFAFRWAYAYAAAPDWYLPRNAYLVTGLAPLVGISLIGLLVAAGAPAGWLLAIWYVLVSNASGAVGDLAVAAWLLAQPPTCLAQDSGDAVTLYLPRRPLKDAA